MCTTLRFVGLVAGRKVRTNGKTNTDKYGWAERRKGQSTADGGERREEEGERKAGPPGTNPLPPIGKSK